MPVRGTAHRSNVYKEYLWTNARVIRKDYTTNGDGRITRSGQKQIFRQGPDEIRASQRG